MMPNNYHQQPLHVQAEHHHEPRNPVYQQPHRYRPHSRNAPEHAHHLTHVPLVENGNDPRVYQPTVSNGEHDVFISMFAHYETKIVERGNWNFDVFQTSISMLSKWIENEQFQLTQVTLDDVMTSYLRSILCPEIPSNLPGTSVTTSMRRFLIVGFIHHSYCNCFKNTFS